MFCYILEAQPYTELPVVDMAWLIPVLEHVVMDIQITHNAGRCIVWNICIVIEANK